MSHTVIEAIDLQLADLHAEIARLEKAKLALGKKTKVLAQSEVTITETKPRRRTRKTAEEPAEAATQSNGTSTRSRSGEGKAAILAALTADGKTASEVAAATGMGRGSVSTTLSKLAKAGEVAKVERGYALIG